MLNSIISLIKNLINLIFYFFDHTHAIEISILELRNKILIFFLNKIICNK